MPLLQVLFRARFWSTLEQLPPEETAFDFRLRAASEIFRVATEAGQY